MLQTRNRLQGIIGTSINQRGGPCRQHQLKRLEAQQNDLKQPRGFSRTVNVLPGADISFSDLRRHQLCNATYSDESTLDERRAILVKIAFFPPNWSSQVKPVRSPPLRTGIKEAVHKQGLLSMKVCMGVLHAGAWLGVVENVAVDLHSGRHASTGVSVASSQPSVRSFHYTPARWQYSRHYRTSCRFLRMTSRTTRSRMVLEPEVSSLSCSPF